MARWNVGLCGSEPAILNSAAKRFQNEVFFHENSRLPRGFFAFADLGFDPCPSLRPWPPGVQKGETVTIRGKLNGTNPGTSAPLTAPFSGVFGAAPVAETGAWRGRSGRLTSSCPNTPRRPSRPSRCRIAQDFKKVRHGEPGGITTPFTGPRRTILQCQTARFRGSACNALFVAFSALGTGVSATLFLALTIIGV
jgi:hypothetical protein